MKLNRQIYLVKKTEIKLSNYRQPHKYTNTVREDGTECLFFSIELDFATVFTDFCWRRFRYTIASLLEQKTVQCFLLFVYGNLVFRLGTPFSAPLSKNIPVFFCVISAWKFRRKIAAVSCNSQEKFHDNSASGVLRRVTVVSAELPAILEK